MSDLFSDALPPCEVCGQIPIRVEPCMDDRHGFLCLIQVHAGTEALAAHHTDPNPEPKGDRSDA